MVMTPLIVPFPPLSKWMGAASSQGTDSCRPGSQHGSAFWVLLSCNLELRMRITAHTAAGWLCVAVVLCTHGWIARHNFVKWN